MMQQELLFERSREENAGMMEGSKLAHRQRLLSALGDGRDWEYTGDCNERQHADGKCTCGHAGIRFEFTIRHKRTRDTRIVGSKCVEIFQTVNPEMVNAIAADVDRLEREAAERKSAARKLLQEKRVQELLDEFDSVAWALDERLAAATREYTYRDGWGNEHIGFQPTRRVSMAVWRGWHQSNIAALRLHDRKAGERYPYRWKQYKSLPAFIKRIEEEIKFVRSLAAGRIFEDREI